MILGFMLFALLGCAPVRISCDDLYGTIDEFGDLVLTEEHTGWGQPDCLSCHSVERMHRLNCTDLDGLELESVREVVERDGQASCSGCHGSNGVTP